MRYDPTDTTNAAHAIEAAIMRAGIRVWIRWTRSDCRTATPAVTVCCHMPD